MNYYEHHLGDYLRDTAHLSMLEDGAYRRLIDAYYIREAPLPAELRDVFRLVRAQSKQDREAVEVVLREFFTQTPDGWRHGRCEREIASYLETIPDREARRENDRERQRRARERRKALFDKLRAFDVVPAYDTKTSELEAMLSRVQKRDASRDVTQPVTRDNTATHTPDTRHQTPEEHPPTPRKRGSVHEFPPGFDAFWSAYPRKTAKPAAAKAFARLKPDDAMLRAMLAAIERQRRWPQWTKDGGEFIPHPATWLNGRRWEDSETSASRGMPADDIFAGAR